LSAAGPSIAPPRRAVVAHHADRMAVQPREPGHERAAVARRDLEEAVAVEHQRQDAAQVVRLAAILRHERQELLLAPLGRVVAGQHRRNLVHRIG
jgi:predicted phage-related endonuclease